MTVGAARESPRTTKLYDLTQESFHSTKSSGSGISRRTPPFVDGGPTCHFTTSILNPRRAEGDGLW